jgi:hypothetical protein
MPASSETVTYNTIAAIALDKLSDKMSDAISTSNAAFYMMKKKGNWNGVSSGGRQLRKSIMYALQTVRPLGSFGTVNINPTESHTSAYWDWVQTAVPVSFSDLEEFRTAGDESIQTIVKTKFQQAKASLEDFFERALMRGQADIDTTSLVTPLTSPVDGSYFIDPITKIVDYSPSTSRSVGGINQNTNSWWRNHQDASSASTLAAFLAELRQMHVKCQRGGGGSDKAPDFHIVEERTFNVYEQALALQHRNPDYNKADIPFDNVLFKGAPVTHSELAPDPAAASANTTVVEGTWWMLNSAYLGFDYDKKKSFKLGSNVRPGNQLVTTALMPVRGALWVNNRRKLGVVGDIEVATLEASTT